MFNYLKWSLAIGVFASSVLAQPVINISFDILDAADPGGPAPEGRLVVDVFVDVPTNDMFVSGLVRGFAQSGATFVYATSGLNTFFPPEGGDRFTTFGSATYERDALARYSPAWTVGQPGIVPETGYSPPSPFAMFEPSFINVVYFVSPLVRPDVPDAPVGRDGWTLRIALDISEVSISGADDIANYHVFPLGQAPPNCEAVFVSNPGTGAAFGTNMTTFNQPQGVGRNWGVYVPEPGSFVMFLIGIASCMRQSR